MRTILAMVVAAGCGGGQESTRTPLQPESKPEAEADPIAPPDAVIDAPVYIEEGTTKVILVDHSFYCFNTGSVRMCASDAGRCAGGAAALNMPNIGPCEEERAVACFLATDVLSGRQDSRCWGTMTMCQTAWMQFSTADTKTTTCVVMRKR